MPDWLYPLAEQGLSVGRQDLLAQLAAAGDSFRQGRPHFKSVEGYVGPDGQTELDVLAEGNAEAEGDGRGDETRGGEVRAVEVRWQVGAASEQALREFVAKQADRPIHRRWFISRGGFRPNAVAFARANGVYLTDGAGYRRLRGLVRQW